MSSNRLDDFDIRKIYHTKAGGREWYWNYNNLEQVKDDRNVRNWLDSDGNNKEGLRHIDGDVWEATGGDNRDLRLEIWSPNHDDEEERKRARWLNVEITTYYKVKTRDDITDPNDGDRFAVQLYGRGGSHKEDDPCQGSALKGRWFRGKKSQDEWRNHSNKACVVKELCHPCYTPNKDENENNDLEEHADNNWHGAKLVIYNLQRNGMECTKQEVYTDARDETNEWKKVSEYVDNGNWKVSNENKFEELCGNCNREKDEILTKPGGKDGRNCISLRTDDVTIRFKKYSCREIDPDRPVS